MSRWKMPSPAMAVGLTALFIALTGGAYAATRVLVHTSGIANSAVTNHKIANGAVGPAKLNGTLKRELAAHGAQGPRGATGAAGAAGATGAAGPAGPAGAAGLGGGGGGGGVAGGSITQLVTSLSSNINVVPPGWADASGSCTSGGASGITTLDGNGLSVSALPNDDAIGGAQYNPTNLTLNDITALTYTEEYSGTQDAAVPFVEFDLANGTSLNYSPYVGVNGADRGGTTTGVFQTWDAVGPNANLLVSHGSTTVTFAQAKTQYGNVAISDIDVQSGCSGGASGGTSSVSNVYLDAGGNSQTFDFVGS
jgi:hypothetical protein